MGIALIDSCDPERKEREECRERLAVDYTFPVSVLEVFNRVTYKEIDRKLKNREVLTYDDAFAGMLYVIAATNAQAFAVFRQEDLFRSHSEAVAKAAAFLQGMAMREAYQRLGVDEIVGLIAAANCDVLVRVSTNQPIMEMCGMGGDKGIRRDDVQHKTINATTLTALLLASSGHLSVKHGSAKNTSMVGSTDAVRDLGVPYKFGSHSELMELLYQRRFVYVDAVLAKTLHDISSLMKIETINHLVGPLALPVDSQTPVHKILGVNDKVDPAVCAHAFVELKRRGVINFQNVAVICGFDRRSTTTKLLTHRDSVLDELSPYESEVHMVVEGTYAGSYRLNPEHFGVEEVPEIWVRNNSESILAANRGALRGENHCEYLSMNVALARLVASATLSDFEKGFPFGLLQRHYQEAFEFISTGNGWSIIE